MDQPLIAVTGATGAVGGRVALELAWAGARQVLLVRDPSRAPELPGADVRRIAGYAAGDDVRADWEVLGWVSSYWAIREGALENVSPHVRELTGRDPVSLAVFLESSPDALAHVTGPERPEPA
jgi:NAD(P)-dependent dehydrogenase (short-subunit alcohol dehydrogenase family)